MFYDRATYTLPPSAMRNVYNQFDLQRAKVKKVVITSSVATINNGLKESEPIPTYTEKDHNKKCSLSFHAYSYSKVKAEEATNKVRKLKACKTFS